MSILSPCFTWEGYSETCSVHVLPSCICQGKEKMRQYSHLRTVWACTQYHLQGLSLECNYWPTFSVNLRQLCHFISGTWCTRGRSEVGHVLHPGWRALIDSILAVNMVLCNWPDGNWYWDPYCKWSFSCCYILLSFFLHFYWNVWSLGISFPEFPTHQDYCHLPS